ncbi:MAG: tubulin-like doman-containing protein, partial [Candidatus Poribacteria bacterium]
CGFIVLPSLFTNDPNDRRFANGYAALKELEFYSLRKDLLTRPLDEEETSTGISFHDFDVEWRLGNRKQIWGPPFNTCYLIDNSTDYGGTILPEQKIEICDMIAESIFMDFSPDTDTFASQKRSIRENLAPQLLNDLEYEYLDSKGNVIHTEIFSYRFSTFGWSKIYIPLDRIINACTYKLSADLVDFWLRKNPAPGDMKEELKRDTMPKLGISMRDVSTSDIFTSLSRINDVGDSVTKAISQWVATLEQNCLDKVKSKTRDLRKFISTEYDKFMRQQFNIGGLDIEGEFVKRIKTINKNALLKQIDEALLNEVGQMIDNRNIRIDLTIKCLTSICELLDEQIKSYSEDFRRAEAQAAKWIQKMERCLQIISESENDWLFRNLTLRTYVKHTSDAIRSYLNMRARMMIDETSVEVCEEIKNRIGYESEIKTTDGKIEVKRGGMILELRQLEDSLQALKARLIDKFDSYDRAEEHVIHINLYKKGDFGDFYLIDGRQINDSVLASIDEEFLTSGEIKSLIELKSLFRSPGIQYVENQITDFCIKKFADIETKSESDAVKTFMQRYSDEGQRNQMINRFYTMGTGWLRKGTHFMGDPSVMNNISSMSYLGIASKRDDEYEEFIKLFRTYNNTAERQNVDSSLVCYYSENAGIPLMYINDLDRYKQCYLEIAKKPSAGLHIDRFDEKYTDILLKSDTEIAALREAIRILLTGTILGAIDVFEDKDERLGYKYMRSGTQPFPLGHEYMAIEMIRSNFTLRAELDHRITDIVSGFDQDKLIQYFIILDYYTNDLFRPKFYKVGNIIEEKLSYEHRALSPVQEEIKITILSTISEEEFNKRKEMFSNKIDEFSIMIGDRRIFKG